MSARHDQACGYRDPEAVFRASHRRLVRAVAVRRFYNSRRSLARRARALVRLAGEAPPAIEEPSRGDDFVLLAALAQLPPGHRVAATLFYLEGLSIKETAGAMTVSTGTVKRHLDRARNKLRPLIERG